MNFTIEDSNRLSCATDDPLCNKKLVWGSGSPPAWRVRLYLEEKKIPYKSKLISFQDNDLKEPEMLALNPRGLVPIFIDDDIVMYESLAILTYLELQNMQQQGNAMDTQQKGGNVSFMPSNQRQQAKALMRMHEVNNLSAYVGEVVYYMRRTKPEDVNEDYLASKRDAMYTEIALWERYFDSGDPFVVGYEISVADIAFFPSLAYTVRLGFDLSNFPRLNSYYRRMCARDAVKASWPPHWLTEPSAAGPLQGL